MKKLLYSIILLICIMLLTPNFSLVHADELYDNITDQLQNLDLSALENLFSSTSINGLSFTETLYSMIKGEYNFDFNSFFSYMLNSFILNIKEILPTLLIIVAIAILSSIFNAINSNFVSDKLSDIIHFVFLITIILIIGGEIIQLFSKVKKIIEFLANLNNIMSPIILTLMIASGGSISATIYKPAVIFLSNGVVNIILSIIFPLIIFSTILSILNTSSTTIKLGKLSESINSIIKWILGLVSAIFAIFLSIQGVSSAIHDGISIRATKFAISNSLPIVGSMIKDGFDLIVAGSVIIKNSIGVVCIFSIFSTILSPVLYMIVFSLLLKIISGIIEPIGDKRISDICIVASKSISYLISTILIVGIMLFISVLLMIFSANSIL